MAILGSMNLDFSPPTKICFFDDCGGLGYYILLCMCVLLLLLLSNFDNCNYYLFYSIVNSNNNNLGVFIIMFISM